MGDDELRVAVGLRGPGVAVLGGLAAGVGIGPAAAQDKEYAAIVLFSYLGLVYMSLVNPGIFCPLVYGLQLVVYFISAEKSGEIPSGNEIRY